MFERRHELSERDLLILIAEELHAMATAAAAATAIESAVTALNALASAIEAATGDVNTNLNETALDQPLADLATAVTSAQTALAALQTAVNPPATETPPAT